MASADSKQNAKSARPGAKIGLAGVLRDDTLGRFVLARGLLLGVPLAAPYIVLLGQAQRASLSNLATFVLASGIATALSSGRWGKLADRSGARCMALGGALASMTALGTFALSYWGSPSQLPAWVWPAIYFVYTVGYTGTRVGRKTYVVDMASGDTRTAYVATSNTAIALLLLAFAGLDSIVSQSWQNFSMLCYGCASMVGVLACLRLANPSQHNP